MFNLLKRRRTELAITSVCIALLLGLTSGAFAAAKLGGACTKPGSTAKTTIPTPANPANSLDPKKGADAGKLSDWPSPDAKYISAIPVDLTQIQSISKYRSCSGHNRDGYTFDQVLETNRSLKHYLFPVAEFQGTLDKVKMFAPFDGTVSRINLETDKVVVDPRMATGLAFQHP